MDIVEGLRVKDNPRITCQAVTWPLSVRLEWSLQSTIYVSMMEKKHISTQMNSHPKKNVMKFYEKQMKYNENEYIIMIYIYMYIIYIMIREKTLRTYPGSHRLLKQHLPNPPQALPPDVNRLALFPSIQVLFVPCVDVELEVFLVELREKWIIWYYYCRYTCDCMWKKRLYPHMLAAIYFCYVYVTLFWD